MCSNGIGAGDWLLFGGSVLGVAGGIAAAFLAVYLQRRAEVKSRGKTILGLIALLEAAAEKLNQEAATDPVKGVWAVLRAFTALRDTAFGVRTTSAAFATLAAGMEHTEVWSQITRLSASQGIVAVDAIARAAEIKSFCEELRTYLRDE